MHLPNEMIEHIFMFVQMCELKQCLYASKNTSIIVKRVVQKRIKNIPWYVLKQYCFIKFQWEFNFDGWVQCLNDRYACTTKMVQSNLETDNNDFIVGKHTIALWSFKDQCYVLHKTYPFKQRVYTSRYLTLIYNKQRRGVTFMRVYSFYKEEDTAYHIFLLNEAQVEMLENPNFKLNNCMSPNGKYIYLFDKHAILSYTGKIYPINSPCKFASLIADPDCYKWIDSTTFTISGSEFECKTPMNVKMKSNSLVVF